MTATMGLKVSLEKDKRETVALRDVEKSRSSSIEFDSVAVRENDSFAKPSSLQTWAASPLSPTPEDLPEVAVPAYRLRSKLRPIVRSNGFPVQNIQNPLEPSLDATTIHSGSESSSKDPQNRQKSGKRSLGEALAAKASESIDTTTANDDMDFLKDLLTPPPENSPPLIPRKIFQKCLGTTIGEGARPEPSSVQLTKQDLILDRPPTSRGLLHTTSCPLPTTEPLTHDIDSTMSSSFDASKFRAANQHKKSVIGGAAIKAPLSATSAAEETSEQIPAFDTSSRVSNQDPNMSVKLPLYDNSEKMLLQSLEKDL